MLRDRGPRHVEVRGDLARRELLVADEPQDRRRRGAAMAFSAVSTRLCKQCLRKCQLNIDAHAATGSDGDERPSGARYARARHLISLTSSPSDCAILIPSSSSARSRATSAVRIALPIQARSRGRQSSCSTNTGSSRLAARDEPVVRLLGRPLEQHPLVGHAGAVMDAVVDREAQLQRSSSTVPGVARAIALNFGMISRSKKTCIRKTFSSSVSASSVIRASCARCGSRSAVPPTSLDQRQPRLAVARLVLHHRRVVDLGLVVRREREELRRHLDRELVGLELLGDHRAPDVEPPRLLLRRAPQLGDRRQVLPGQGVDAPLGALREVVEAEDLLVPLAPGRRPGSRSTSMGGDYAYRGSSNLRLTAEFLSSLKR